MGSSLPNSKSTEIKATPPQENTLRNAARWVKIWYMLISLVIGSGLAIGHDGFYRYLDGNRVDAILSQTWVTNIGTAFAFLFKMFLTITTGIAFVQYQWKVMKQKDLKVDEVDTMTAMLEDIFSLLQPKLWLNAPILTLVAVITWLIPIAAVFPPGTLSVTFVKSDFLSEQNVPQLRFTNNSFWNTWSGTIANYGYQDASPTVYQATLAAATSGQVLAISHDHVNMSYSLNFYGPAIKCQNASQQFSDLAISHTNNSGSGGGMFYVSVVGGDPLHNLTNATYAGCGSNNTYCYREPLDPSTPFETLDFDSTDSARLYVQLGFESNFTECKLYNATYEVDFNYTGTSQQTTVRNLTYHNTVAAVSSPPYWSDGENYFSGLKGGYFNASNADFSTNVAYQSVMQAFGSLFVGVLTGHLNAYTRYYTLVEALSIAPQWNATYSTGLFQPQMEELFQNVTLSMLSSPKLQKDLGDADNNVVPVTITTYPAVYHYQPLRLWLAYGLGIGLTMVCLFAGLLAMHGNGASYSNRFSTYIRATRDLHLYRPLGEDDDGANPCPEELRITRVVVNSRQAKALELIPNS